MLGILVALLSLFLTPSHTFNCTSLRSDGACYLDIPGGGSLQNPSLSPDGNLLVYTRWERSYNRGTPSICVYNMKNGAQKCIAQGVNLPGVGIWKKHGDSNYSVVYSGPSLDGSDADAAISLNLDSMKKTQLSKEPKKQAWEPTFSPDGAWIVYEQHRTNEDNEYDGVIVMHKLDTEVYLAISPPNWLCKQPYWSPAGDVIAFQRSSSASESADIDIYAYNLTSKKLSKVLAGASDVSFSANGKWMIYSNEESEGVWAAEFANTTHVVRLSKPPKNHYDGACAISFDGKYMLFESVNSRDPESGTKFARIMISPTNWIAA